MKKQIFFLLSLSFFLKVESVFETYKAVQFYKNGDYKKAQDIFKKELVQTPTDAKVLFDNGDVAYRLKEYDQAFIYFKKSAEYAKDSLQKEQSLYNLGNTFVQKKEYQNAIDLYDKVLELNPKNIDAQHNKKVAQELLKKQKKDQEKKEEQQKEKEKQKQDQNNKQQNQDQNQENQEKQEEQKQQEDQQKKEKEQDQQGQNNDQQQEKQQQKEDQNKQGKKENNKNNEQEDVNNKDQQQKHNQQEQEQNQKNESSGQNEQEKKNQESQNKDPLNQLDKDKDLNKNKKEQKEEQLSVEQKDEPDEEKDEVARAIDQVDGQTGKQFFKNMVKAKMEPQYGQKNW